MIFRLACAAVAICIATHSSASEFCSPKAAFRICHALHQTEQPSYAFYSNCMDTQKAACEAALDLSQKFFPSSTEGEKAALQNCATNDAGRLDWIYSFECGMNVAKVRNERIYTKFLADRSLQDPGNLGATCTNLYVAADDVRRCLGDNKHLFLPTE
ncbi:hypothetical protein [Leisingera sp. M523]|uniref:hypothetical protein n=1 Tax=Leisingera sp. M523 TaxID=2867013 RepID=UPI0021A7FD8B|nr:hypothetical protein [Leisingera sp. M523]UWQ29899.1 hypothetical protein K3557_04945 [Leisingera sp. M523]